MDYSSSNPLAGRIVVCQWEQLSHFVRGLVDKSKRKVYVSPLASVNIRYLPSIAGSRRGPTLPVANCLFVRRAAGYRASWLLRLLAAALAMGIAESGCRAAKSAE